MRGGGNFSRIFFGHMSVVMFLSFLHVFIKFVEISRPVNVYFFILFFMQFFLEVQLFHPHCPTKSDDLPLNLLLN